MEQTIIKQFYAVSRGVFSEKNYCKAKLLWAFFTLCTIWWMKEIINIYNTKREVFLFLHMSLQLLLYSRNLLKLLHIIKKYRIVRILRFVFAMLLVGKQKHPSTNDIVLGNWGRYWTHQLNDAFFLQLKTLIFFSIWSSMLKSLNFKRDHWTAVESLSCLMQFGPSDTVIRSILWQQIWWF